ncbi:MAG: hypothetical protein ACRDL5_13050, partial [Solirubrobacteraceae bacterium]
MNRAVGLVGAAGAIRPEEREAAGQLGAVVWMIASLSVIAMAIAMPASEVDRTATIALGAAGCLWGLLSGLLLDYRRLPAWLIHVSALGGLAAIAVADELSGGARSPAWACLFYVVVFAAYFFKPVAAAAYFLACVAVQLAVVVDAPSAIRQEAIAKLAV